MKHANDNGDSNEEPLKKPKRILSPGTVVTRTKKLVTTCSFCGKEVQDVRKMVVSETAGICDECVFICLDIYYHGVGWPSNQIPHPHSIHEMIKIGHVTLDRSQAENLLTGEYRLPNKDVVNGAEILTTLFNGLRALALLNPSNKA